MNSSYFAHLIGRRYPQKLSSAQAKKDAGFRVKVEGELKATTLKEGIQEIEIKLSQLEAELFGSSKEYKELVRLENCWRRLQIDADKIKINNNKNYQPKKKRRIDEEDNNISKEVGVEHIISQESVGERDKFNQLQQMLLDNQEKHTAFMNSTKDFAERIMKKICHFHETSQLRKKSIKPMSSRGSRHSEKDEGEETLYKMYGIRASLLSKKGGGGNLPKSLGRTEQGISSPITALRGTRTPRDKSGIWTELDAPISENSKNTICFQRAHQTTESSSSTSIGENGFITPFGVINFTVRDDCRYMYILAHNKICNAYFGSYGIVVCPQDDQYAYKLLFCQDNSDGVAQVLVDGNSRKIRRSSYKDAIYERRISDRLASNVILKKFCILVNDITVPLFHGVVMLRMPRVDGSRARFWHELQESQYEQIFTIVKLFHKEGFLHGDCHLGNFMIPEKEKSLVRILDFERVFICEEPNDRNSIRFDGILKAMDALSLFNNSFFDKNNFNPFIPQQYERIAKIYHMMKKYILELLPVTSSFEYHANKGDGELLDKKIFRLFHKWHPNARRTTDQAATLIELNSDLAALYNENVLWLKGNPKTFLQYITYLKGRRLELSLK